MEDKKLDNAIKYLTKDYEESDTTAAFMLCTRWALGDALELLKEQQRIVRCMDCKWNSGTSSYPYCQWFSESRAPIWFCANGERKNND